MTLFFDFLSNEFYYFMIIFKFSKESLILRNEIGLGVYDNLNCQKRPFGSENGFGNKFFVEVYTITSFSIVKSPKKSQSNKVDRFFPFPRLLM